jgi:peptidyl-prolyl cis-trans isomerase A (cyclophilin A)
MRSPLLLVALAISCAAPLAPGEASALPPSDADLVAANEALGDPYAGRFPYAEAVAGLAAAGTLRAKLVTDLGDVDCVLEPDHAPLTVANFVGLARGLRPFRGEDGRWQRARFYDGSPFHRALPEQLVQAGRRGKLADGGFLLQDEIGVGDSFDRPGVLAMANSGQPHSGSTEFFVTTGPTPQLEGQHTIFGRCDGEATLRRIEKRVLSGDDPDPPVLRTIEVTRG